MGSFLHRCFDEVPSTLRGIRVIPALSFDLVEYVCRDIVENVRVGSSVDVFLSRGLFWCSNHRSVLLHGFSNLHSSHIGHRLDNPFVVVARPLQLLQGRRGRLVGDRPSHVGCDTLVRVFLLLCVFVFFNRVSHKIENS